MTHIKVTGPGGAISVEMLIIQRALEEYGIPVIVEDSYPYSDRGLELSEDDYLNRCKLIKDKQPVKLVAEHCPWGG